jgi:nucleoside-diphosphate-sugar epimerase
MKGRSAQPRLEAPSSILVITNGIEMVVLVTGATGSVGSHLVPALPAQGASRRLPVCSPGAFRHALGSRWRSIRNQECACPLVNRAYSNIICHTPSLVKAVVNMTHCNAR